MVEMSSVNMENLNSNELVSSTTRLTNNSKNKNFKEKWKGVLKKMKVVIREITVEPCVFIYMLCISLSGLAVQNMHLEKACRVNFQFGDEICDRIRDRNTTGLENELDKIHVSVADVVAWRLPLQTALPALTVLFLGAWSDKYKKRKIFLILPVVGELISNVGLLLATYYFYELSLTATALIETLPSAFSGSYIIFFMGMYTFMADRTTLENRTFRLGLAAISANIGTPTGTMLSGVLLNSLGYYGMFTLLLVLHATAIIYSLFKLEDVLPTDNTKINNEDARENKCSKSMFEILWLVGNTVLVALKPRAFNGRLLIFCVLILYIIMVGPLYGDSQVGYLYAIRKFNFTAVEYSIYGTINVVLGLLGTIFCVSVLSKIWHVQDSTIGCLAGVSRIASSFVFAFAPTRLWYYSAPIFNIFSYTGLIAIRSIATKSVPTEEVAKLSSLIGVTEGIASAIYNPISSAIYTSTMETFPGAFYMFDVGLTLLALALFILTYFIEKNKRKSSAKHNDHHKEDSSRSNHIQCFM